jgi:hypothetical protein
MSKKNTTQVEPCDILRDASAHILLALTKHQVLGHVFKEAETLAAALRYYDKTKTK